MGSFDEPSAGVGDHRSARVGYERDDVLTRDLKQPAGLRPDVMLGKAHH